MASTVLKGLLYLSSYLPLLVIFTFQYWDLIGYYSLAFSIIGCLSIGLLLFYVHTTSVRGISIKSFKLKDADVMAYVITYLFPFLGVTENNLISFIIFFIILGVIYINSNMLYVNPVLIILGYHTFEVESSDGAVNTIMVPKNRLRKNEDLQVVVIDDNFCMGRLR